MQRYILIETLIAVTIAVVLSVGFAWLFFGHRPDISLQTPALVHDTAIQSFIVALGIALPATLIARRRVRAGTVHSSDPWGRWPGNAVGRALLIAITVAAGFGVLHQVSATILPTAALSLQALLIFKGALGAAIAILVAPVAVRAALGEGRS